MARNEVKWGAILSYLLIIINAFYGFFLTPYILSNIGQSDYGVYRTISAFTTSFMVLDLGLGGTVMRYISRFKADGEEKKIPNFLAMSLIQATIIELAIGVIMVCLYFVVGDMFSKSFTSAEIEKAEQLYIFLSLGLVAHIFENVMNGIVTGHNRFTFGNGLKVLRIIIRILLVIVFIGIFKDSLVLVVIDLALTLALILCELFYICFVIKQPIKFTHWDGSLFKESLMYTILMFITAIAAQVNSNLDNVVIGTAISPEAVTVYSMGLLIFGMFEQISTAISGVMLPTVTNTLKADDENRTNTQAVIVKAGRVQFVLLGAVFVGFAVLGRTFVDLWLGVGYEDVYMIVMILMPPALLELCVNVTLSVLRAENRLKFKTGILLGSTVLNATITIVGCTLWNYYAAAIGTAVSFLLGSVIIMNIYYFKKLRFNMLRIYRKILDKIWVCLMCAGVACYLSTFVPLADIWSLVLGVSIFVLVYALTLLLFGLNNDEKRNLRIKRGV